MLAMKILIVCCFILGIGLASATLRRSSLPQLFYALNTPEKEQRSEVATDQVVIPPEVIKWAITKAAPLVISEVVKFLRYAVCDNTVSQLQGFAGREERDANVMALVHVMSDVLGAEERLDEVKQLNVKGNLVAQAELFDWVNSVKSKLKSTFCTIGAATKKLLCNDY